VGLILTTLAAAGVLARLIGGRLTGLEGLPVRGWPLLAGLLGGLCVGAAAALAGLPGGVRCLGLATAAGCALMYSRRNRAVYGIGLVGAGLLANALVVGVNGGMPVSATAASRAGADYAAAVGNGPHVPAGPGSVLPWLGDVIPVPLPLRPEVVSVGDVLAATGLAQALATTMLLGAASTGPAWRPRRRPTAVPRAPVRPARRPRSGPRPATAATAWYGSSVRVIRRDEPENDPAPR
jgi:hypothetical protein